MISLTVPGTMSGGTLWVWVWGLVSVGVAQGSGVWKAVCAMRMTD